MIVACVRVGTKYGPEYVERLRAGVKRWLPRPHEFVCLGDNDCDGLPGWWAKLKLFDPVFRGNERLIYFDLDTVLCGDVTPLADLDVRFGICANFTRAAGHLLWPCHYGSAVMTISPEYDRGLWEWFMDDREGIMRHHRHLGDQAAIEEFDPYAVLLQDVLPTGFFLGYRDLPKHKTPPPECSVVVFAGNAKPHNTNCEWARAAWQEAA